MTQQKEVSICAAYMVGLSQNQVGEEFGVCSSTVANVLRRRGIPSRSVALGNSLRWKDPAFHANQVSKRTGKPSGSSGKTWTCKKPHPRRYGPQNARWKGGKTALAKLIRSMPEYRRWRTSVFVRDGFSCTGCGAERGYVEADHIVPLSVLMVEHSIANSRDALECAALWDVTNGRTLCRPCHRETPTFGRKLLASMRSGDV